MTVTSGISWQVDLEKLVYTPSDDYQVIKGRSDFLIILKAPFNRDELSFSVDDVPDQTWTGEAIEPSVTVTYHSELWGDKELVEGTDYTLSYANNVNVGEATITITGVGEHYAGTMEVNFNIVPVEADPADITVVVNPDHYTYTGEEILITKDALTVSYKGTELADDAYGILFEEGGDFTNAGEKPFTVSLTGTLSGEKEAEYYIDPVDVATLDITVESPKTYTSQKIEPAVTVKFGEVELNVDGAEDYTVEYANNINAGEEAQAIIKGVEGGNFSGETTVNFTIKKRNLRDTGDPERM